MNESLVASGAQGGSMSVIVYRLYCLQDGRIMSTTQFQAADDVAAMEIARQRKSPMNCELWCDQRLIAFIPAMGPRRG